MIQKSFHWGKYWLYYKGYGIDDLLYADSRSGVAVSDHPDDLFTLNHPTTLLPIADMKFGYGYGEMVLLQF